MQKKEGPISKLIQIGKAYMSDAPDTAWYVERNAICDVCEFNTKNKKDPTALDKAQNKFKPACSVCHCFIDEKTKVEEATCGLEEAGMAPKWFPVSVPVKGHSSIRLENLSPELLTLDYSKSGDVFCNMDSKNIVERFKLKVRKCTLSKVKVSCSCVSVETEVEGDDAILNVSVSTVGFRQGVTERKIYLEYYKTKAITSTITITLNINKDE